jgi:hypothetical protein
MFKSVLSVALVAGLSVGCGGEGPPRTPDNPMGMVTNVVSTTSKLEIPDNFLHFKNVPIPFVSGKDNFIRQVPIGTQPNDFSVGTIFPMSNNMRVTISPTSNYNSMAGVTTFDYGAPPNQHFPPVVFNVDIQSDAPLPNNDILCSGQLSNLWNATVQPSTTNVYDPQNHAPATTIDHEVPTSWAASAGRTAHNFEAGVRAVPFSDGGGQLRCHAVGGAWAHDTVHNYDYANADYTQAGVIMFQPPSDAEPAPYYSGAILVMIRIQFPEYGVENLYYWRLTGYDYGIK